MGRRQTQIVVALPAKNEEQRILAALEAIDAAARRVSVPVRVLVFVNNTDDATAEIVSRASGRLSDIAIRAQSATLAPAAANAGTARKSAVDRALSLFGAGDDDILLTTDADARLHQDCLSRMLSAFGDGADLVLAKLHCVPDAFEPAPPRAVDLAQRKAEWRHRVRELVEAVRSGHRHFPPAHDDYGGAGIAARVLAYRQLGGFRAVEFNEDFQFVRSADHAGMNVNRRSGATIDVLTRRAGRATGGMAQDLSSCASAVARGLTAAVERHDLTLARIMHLRSHAHAFSDHVREWESIETAIAGLERALAAFEQVPTIREEIS